MSLIHCEQCCAHHHKCAFIVLAMRGYRELWGEPSPMECAFFTDHQDPACRKPRPEKMVAGRDFD